MKGTLKELKPVEVDDALFAFPGDIAHLMPVDEHIPHEFKVGDTAWNTFFCRMFFTNTEGVGFLPVDGIDVAKAHRHISCIMRSYEPKHEEKEAAVSYLMSLWFVDVIEDYYGKPGEYKNPITGEMIKIEG